MEQPTNANKSKGSNREGVKKVMEKTILHHMTLKSILKQSSNPSPRLEICQITDESMLKSVQTALLLKKELSYLMGKKWKKFYILSQVEENFLKFNSCHLPHFLNTLPPFPMKKKTYFRRVSFSLQEMTRSKPVKNWSETQLNIIIFGLDFQPSSLNPRRSLKK